MTPHLNPHCIGQNPDAVAHTATYSGSSLDLQRGGVVT